MPPKPGSPNYERFMRRKAELDKLDAWGREREATLTAQDKRVLQHARAERLAAMAQAERQEMLARQAEIEREAGITGEDDGDDDSHPGNRPDHAGKPDKSQ